MSTTEEDMKEFRSNYQIYTVSRDPRTINRELISIFASRNQKIPLEKMEAMAKSLIENFFATMCIVDLPDMKKPFGKKKSRIVVGEIPHETDKERDDFVKISIGVAANSLELLKSKGDPRKVALKASTTICQKTVWYMTVPVVWQGATVGMAILVHGSKPSEESCKVLECVRVHISAIVARSFELS